MAERENQKASKRIAREAAYKSEAVQLMIVRKPRQASNKFKMSQIKSLLVCVAVLGALLASGAQCASSKSHESTSSRAPTVQRSKTRETGQSQVVAVSEVGPQAVEGSEAAGSTAAPIRVGAKKEPQKQQQQVAGEGVVPERESHGNSQLVFVNLERVVSEQNDTTRLISSQPQLVKADAQISCGETNKNGQPSDSDEAGSNGLWNRIVGGNKAEPGEFPYQVRLNIRSRRGSSLCGGVIIDKRHILTAAHCMTTW